MAQVPFVKYSGCGNDFIIFDARTRHPFLENPTIIESLCRRRLGIGADGVILLENGIRSDYQMRIFNSDGSEAEMCGNGMRCLGRFIAETDSRTRFSITCFGKEYAISVNGERIDVAMPAPQILDMDVKIPHDGLPLEMAFIDTGVPHVVLFMETIAQAPVQNIGPYLRHHSRFSPRGTNVNFSSLHKDGRLFVRTYERGVENETLACGTGCAAVATAARQKFGLQGPIETVTTTGDTLCFSFHEGSSGVESMTMGGPAQKIFSGQIEIEKLLNPTLFS